MNKPDKDSQAAKTFSAPVRAPVAVRLLGTTRGHAPSAVRPILIRSVGTASTLVRSSGAASTSLCERTLVPSFRASTLVRSLGTASSAPVSTLGSSLSAVAHPRQPRFAASFPPEGRITDHALSSSLQSQPRILLGK